VADSDDPIEVGAETSYAVRVTNAGSKTEAGLQLTCPLPPQLELRTAKCLAGGNYHVEGREVVFDPLPKLAPKADVVYRLQVRGVATGDARFRARVQAEGLGQPVVREESTKVYGD
jgi:hypothetical protein